MKTTRGGGAEPAWFTANGRRHRGEVGEDADGLPFGAAELACGTCGGTGVSKHSPGRQCRGCMGEKVSYQQFRIYDADGLAALKVSRAMGAVPKPRGAFRGGAATRPAAGRDTRPRPAYGKPRSPGPPAGRPAKGRPPRAARTSRARPPSRSEEAMRETYEEYRASHAGLFERAENVANEFVKHLLANAREWGGLTEAQRLKMEEVVTGIERARSVHAASGFVGALKDRFDVDVTCTEHRSFLASKFKGRGKETKHVTGMVDAAGNVYFAFSAAFSLSPGETATITGTVSKHEERDGYRVTYVNRVVASNRVPAPPGWVPPTWEPPVPDHIPAAPDAAGDAYESDFEDLPPQYPGM